ncbi:isomerase [Tupanvirus soda lake]|uniref:Isomerase n=2 Tax=Tupanvirus TaxID=2094720 RepID=A0A6N1NU89_9VIRU|nr:isomerase [Tupanvirus soda lake]QKU35897.1 isomerase [Tupanvirus soda lake]
MKVWEKSIQNPSKTPWADWIINGNKIWEGRLCRDDWMNVCVDDIIIFKYDDNKKLKVVVTELKHFADFGEAFRQLGIDLVPIDGISVEQVESLYMQFYSKEDTMRYGVVAVGVKPLD